MHTRARTHVLAHTHTLTRGYLSLPPLLAPSVLWSCFVTVVVSNCCCLYKTTPNRAVLWRLWQAGRLFQRRGSHESGRVWVGGFRWKSEICFQKLWLTEQIPQQQINPWWFYLKWTETRLWSEETAHYCINILRNIRDYLWVEESICKIGNNPYGLFSALNLLTSSWC